MSLRSSETIWPPVTTGACARSPRQVVKTLKDSQCMLGKGQKLISDWVLNMTSPEDGYKKAYEITTGA